MIVREGPLVLCVDDAAEWRVYAQLLLEECGYVVATAESAEAAWEALRTTKPDLVLLDAVLPNMDGYEFCRRAQETEDTAWIPMVLWTGNPHEQDRVRAFAAGASEFVSKAEGGERLKAAVARHLGSCRKWRNLRSGPAGDRRGLREFLDALCEAHGVAPARRADLSGTAPADLYPALARLGIGSVPVAQAIARWLEWPYRSEIDPGSILLGILPTSFCRANLVVPVRASLGRSGFVLGNPFDRELLATLVRVAGDDARGRFSVTAPEALLPLFQVFSFDAVAPQFAEPAC